VDEHGFLKVCCVGEGAANFLSREDGSRLNVRDNVPEERVLNHARLVGLRRAMLEGRWDPICRRCHAAERAGGTSSRHGRNHHLRQHVAPLLAETADDGTVGTGARIRHLDMRLGNACNLTCRMCGPGASRLWIEPYNRVQPAAYQMDEARLASMRDITWVEDPGVWTRFRALLPDLEWLHFAGGEPMMIPAMTDALRMCVDEGVAGRIHLSYNSNLTLLPRGIEELWPRFKRVSISASVDGYGALNEYIRRPSRWADIDRNLRTLDRHFRDWGLTEVIIGTTVQAYNVLDLDQLYRYLRDEFTHVLPLPSLSPLTWPSYLSVQTLPQRIKDRAREKLLLEKARPAYAERPDIAWVLGTIDEVLDHLDGADLAEQADDFAGFTERSEREFGDSLLTAAPELGALLRRPS